MRILLEGKTIYQVVDSLWPLLSGRYSKEEIIDLLPEEYKETSQKILESLTDSGFTLKRPAFDEKIRGPESHLSFFESSFGKPEIQATLNHAAICLVGKSPLADAVAAELNKSGINSIEKVAPANEMDSIISESHLTILCLTRQDREICDSVNHTCFTHGLPWLLTLAEGQEGWVGPFVLPGETACSTCLTSRLDANSLYSDFSNFQQDRNRLSKDFEPQDGFPSLNPFYSLIAAMASLEVIRHITGISRPLTYDAQLVVDCITGNYRHETLHRVPRCPQCSSIGKQRSSIMAFTGVSDDGI